MNRKLNNWFLVFVSAIFSLPVHAQDVHAQQSPANVSGHPDETKLNTISLTEQAVTRLGIETVAIRKDSVANIRVFGGTIIEPSGNHLQIVSPYDAVVLSPESSDLPVAGTLIAKGGSILRLSVLPLPQQVQGAQARTTELKIARARVERAAQLLKDGAGSLRDLENAQQALADSEAAYKATVSGDEVSSVNITAPQDVIIKDIYVASGQLISAGKPLVDLTNTGATWVRVPIYAGYQNNYSHEAGALIQNLGNTDKPPLQAKYIDGPLTADSMGSSIDLYFELDNSDRRFRPGQRVSVSLTENTIADRYVVPHSAIFRDIYGGTWVYVQHEPGVYVRERVELEQVINDLAVLKQAPAEGTPVVTIGVAELAGTEFGVAH